MSVCGGGRCLGVGMWYVVCVLGAGWGGYVCMYVWGRGGGGVYPLSLLKDVNNSDSLSLYKMQSIVLSYLENVENVQNI